MRVTGGKARGIPLHAPAGGETRPATDRMREAVFSSLGAWIEGRSTADCFAGTGAYGLEALSRGAAPVVFFENSHRALACLRRNRAAVCRSGGFSAEDAPIKAGDIFRHGERNDFAPELIFLDPPYATSPTLLPRLAELPLIAGAPANARLVIELPGNQEPRLPGWQCLRRIGKTGRDKPTAAILTR